MPSSVALPMESFKRRHVTLKAIAVCKLLTLLVHLFPADCMTGECPITEKPSLMVATKWIFQFGAQNSHGSPDQNPVLRDRHLKSGKEVMTFSQQRYGELAMLDIMLNSLHGILLTHRNRFPMIIWAFGNQFASHR